MATPFEPMIRVGGGRRPEEDAFAGLGGAFAGPGVGGTEFTASYLQNRIKGMNRATVSPRVNQMRVMASPEFALAKTLGISTPYNSGGSQVDVQRARERMNSPSALERDAATAQMAKFQQRAAGAPRNLVMSAAGLASPGDAIQADDSYSGPVPSQSGFDEIQKRFGKPQNKIQEIPTTPGGSGGGSTPTIPSPNQATGVRPEPYNVAATPPSAQSARDAALVPIGAELPATSGEPSRQAASSATAGQTSTTPVKETTKGPRLDTQRISDANDMRDAAIRAKDFTGDASEKMALQNQVNIAQDAREAAKKSYDTQVGQQAAVEARNQKFFGNPQGPDGGRSFAERDKPPALSPVGGYEERYTVGKRGQPAGDPDAKRGTPGYTFPAETENVPVGPMTNQPAKTPQERDERIAKFNAEGEARKQRNQTAAVQKAVATERSRVDQLNKKYAGPIGRRA